MVEWHGLTTREWASLSWVVVLVVAGLAWPSVRRPFVALLKAVLGMWQLHVAFVAFVGWAVLVCWLAHLVHAWNADLLKDAIAWMLIYGIASILSATRAGEEEHFFRRAALAALGVGVLMQFLLNLHTFPFVVELVLQPVLTFLILVQSVAGSDRWRRPVQRLLTRVLVIAEAWIVIATAKALWNSWRGIDPEPVDPARIRWGRGSASPGRHDTPWRLAGRPTHGPPVLLPGPAPAARVTVRSYT